MSPLSPAIQRQALQAVLVGGSAGAIEVVSLVLGALPADFATPIVVVIHLPRSKPSALAGALRGKCGLALREALDKEPLAPATVYLAPPDYHLLIDPGPCFALSVDEPVNFSRPSVDVLFQSAADVLGPRCAGVLVSGANPDGAQGLRAIQEAGGLVAIQDPEEAAQSAMPKAALALCPNAPRLSAKAISQWVQQLSAWQTSTSRGAK
ncbi:MAG TPA: chemotaxis protein CheB [Polyangia bacterium]|jgi:Chemotaxis response regulator containing a CheY-like receiver domain and a methylesterase domain|nr:chemotaxis protein CheB [Polyangia bacterium]